jgi:hypothetical protein
LKNFSDLSFDEMVCGRTLRTERVWREHMALNMQSIIKQNVETHGFQIQPVMTKNPVQLHRRDRQNRVTPPGQRQ